MNKTPISIIIPVFNREVLIKETLESISRQSFNNWECIIVDDGSTDNTRDVVKAFCIEDKRMRFFERTRLPKGPSTCRNIGLNNAKGEYILFFDSDDIMHSDTIQTRIEYISKHPDCDYIVFQMARFFISPNKIDRIWNNLSMSKDNDLMSFLAQDPVWSVCGPIWKKDFLINKAISYNEYRKSWEDWEFNLIALLKSMNYKKVSNGKIDLFQRFHSDDSVGKRYSPEVIKDRVNIVFNICQTFKQSSVEFSKEYQSILFTTLMSLFNDKLYQYNKGDWNKVRKLFPALGSLTVFFWEIYCLLTKNNNHITRFIRFKIMRSGCIKLFGIVDYTLVPEKNLYRYKLPNTQ